MTTYKGYDIAKSGRRRFVITLNNKNIKFITGSLQSVHFYIDSSLEDMTPQPVDPYEGLELSEDVPTSEEINEALGVKEVCSFTEAVEANVAETKDFITYQGTPIYRRTKTLLLGCLPRRVRRRSKTGSKCNYGKHLKIT